MVRLGISPHAELWRVVCVLLAGGAILGPAPGAREGTPAASAPAPAESGSIYCTACGARNRAGSRFCLKDGAPLPAPDPARKAAAGFVPDPDTLPREQAQATVQRAARSVVRIGVLATADLRYPVVARQDEGAGHSVYFLQTLEGEAALSGSGFAIGASGEIVTNAHVASPFGTEAGLTVQTTDGRAFPARLVGIDRASDIALLKVESHSIDPLEWGDSEALNLGEETWAIGHPLDIGLSVTRGTISSIGRVRPGLNQVEAYVHSDAYITHGSSGGPLVDLRGRVVGISTMGLGQDRGQGYSIPAAMARRVIARLQRSGRYDRGYLGLHVRPIDSESIRKHGVRRHEGVVVESVLEGSPAGVSGAFRPGDVVFGINGRLAPSTYLLQEAVSSVGPDVPLRLTLDRQGEVREVPVTTASRPDAPRIDPIRDLESYLMAAFEEDQAKRRVVVRVADPFSLAPKYGLVDGTPIQSAMPPPDWPVRGHPREGKPPEPTPLRTLEDLRAVLSRSYMGGRVGIHFRTGTDRVRGASIAFDEIWKIVI